MTKEYDNTNRGVLFVNNRKEKDTHPDFTGNLNVGGTEYWLSAWEKEGQRGTFLSISITAKDAPKKAGGFLGQKPQPEAVATPKPAFGIDADGGIDSTTLDDDIPF